MAIQIEFLGAAGTVTGSQFLVRVGERRVLVDCGMFQGSPDEVLRNRMPFAFPPESLDAVVLTHAHVDHCARLPALVRAGYRGPVYATPATRDLAEIVLRDSAKLQKESVARWHRRHPEAGDAEATARAKSEAPASEAAAIESDDARMPERLRSAPPEGRTTTPEPLYDEGDVDQTMTQFRGVLYETPTEIAKGIDVVLHDAGHILGSAIVEMRANDGAQSTTIVFSGDLGRSGTPILRDPTPLAKAEWVVVESTYGNREHADHETATEELVAAITSVAGDRGVLLVPAYAVGRTQELVWVLDNLVRQGRIPALPLYVDSPMASRATDVYLAHPDAYDSETLALLRSGDSPLEYPQQHFTNSVEQSKAIRAAPRPIIVVASSGMLTGGRVMHHLKDFLPDPACSLLFIGYQGEGTLGRHLQNGGRTARIDGQELPVRCRIVSISGFSAHADQSELTDWLRALGAHGSQPRRVFIVHGDPDAASAFADLIRESLHLDAHVPEYREVVTLG